MSVDPTEAANRLDAVAQYRSSDPPMDGAFDHIAEIARQYFDCKAAVVSIVDKDGIWFQAHPGLDVDHVGPDGGLCASAVFQDDPWIVNDASIDPRTLANPLVAGDLGLRFYAGIPLKTESGYNLGTLAVLDLEPRTLRDTELQILKQLASIVVEIMDLRMELFRNRRFASTGSDYLIHDK